MTEFFHQALHALIHTLEHTWYILPMLFFVYLVIEILEHKAVDKLRRILASKNLGIVSAAALGLFPQCGFSVAAANLYSEKLISAGVVAAVFVATSDEAFPILVANPSSAKWFLPTLIIKLVWAIGVGYLVNLIFKLTHLDRASVRHHHSHEHSAHHEHVHKAGEHHHCAHCDSDKGIVKATVTRTLSIFAFIFVTSLVLHLAIDLIGQDKLEVILMNDSPFQPLLAALIGLIPNCAASVITTELFASGAIGYGALVASLCAGAGVGMLVLFRVNKNHKQNFAILGIVYLTSALLGTVIEIFL